MILEFFEPCIPPTTTHQSKHFTIRGKPGSEIYGLSDTAALTNARLFWMATFSRHRIEEVIPPPISLTLEITYPWRKKDSKKLRKLGRIYMTEKPDASNTAKTVEDILVHMRFIEDDNAVSELIVRKFRGDAPGILVRISGPILAGLTP